MVRTLCAVPYAACRDAIVRCGVGQRDGWDARNWVAISAS